MIYAIRRSTYNRLKGTKLEPVGSDLKIVIDNEETAEHFYNEMVTTANECTILKKQISYVDWFIPHQHEDGHLDIHISAMGKIIKSKAVGVWQEDECQQNIRRENSFE